jgi:ubiquitin thioesterase OTU1
VGDLRSSITEKTSLTRFDIKYGYPPKPLYLDSPTTLLSSLDVRLDGEQLTISAYDGPVTEEKTAEKDVGGSQSASKDISPTSHKDSAESRPSGQVTFAGMPGAKAIDDSKDPISLKRKGKDMEVPELPLPDRGATMCTWIFDVLNKLTRMLMLRPVLRVMPDDNSCLFRAFGTAVLPGDDLSMRELRSLVASAIQAQPDVFTKVVLEQSPDDYCIWIQTEDAWGGAIELTILSQHFEIEVCSVDVQVCKPFSD